MKRFLSLFLCLLICLTAFGQSTILSESQQEQEQNKTSIDSLFAEYQLATGENALDLSNTLAKALVDWTDTLYSFTSRQTKEYVGAMILSSMATYYYYSDNFLKTIEAATKAVPLLEKLNDSILLTDNYATLGGAYQRTGNFDNALKCSQKCLEIETKLGDKARQSSSLNDLAAIYLANKRYDIAIQYLNQAIDLERTLNRSLNLAIRLGMIASAYLNIGEFDKAITSIQEALDLDMDGGREGKVAIRLSQMGDIYFSQNKYSMSQIYYKEALRTFERLSMDNSASICLLQLGAVSNELGHPSQAYDYLLRCITLCKKTGNSFILQKGYEKIYLLQKSINPSLALQYLEKTIALKDSIYNI